MLFCQYIRKISTKLYHRKKLGKLEKLAWKSARNALRMELKTSNCDLFFSMRMREWGTCCRVMAAGEFFGFCTVLRLLHVGKHQMEELLISKRHVGKGLLRSVDQSNYEGRRQEKNSSREWPEKLNLLRKSLRRSLLRWYNYYGYYSPYKTHHDTVEYDDEGIEDTIVLYIDLWAVPCNPPLDRSLCSQFVSHDSARIELPSLYRYWHFDGVHI